MAVITIPSSFSPIAAALDVFTQDRLAQQKRARQAEQDAWNREARARQRQGWSRQDEMQRRQDLLWQRQQDEYNKQQAKLAALGDATWQDKQIYNTGSYESPEYDKYRGAIGRSALGGQEENVPTVAPEQMQIANAFERAMASKRMANTHGVAPMTAAKIHAGQPQEFDQEALREALFTYQNTKPGDVNHSMAYLALKRMGLSAGHINEIAGPEAAAQFSMEDYGGLNQVFRGDPMYTGTNVSMGDEEAEYDDADVAVTPTQRQRLDALLARDELVGRKTTQSDLDSIFNPKADAVKKDKSAPFTHFGKAYSATAGDIQTGDVMEGVAAVMQEALLAGEAGGDEALTEPFDINALFPAMKEEELMSNMWQAAQMIQREHFPDKTPQLVFEEMKRTIGSGPDKLDLINTAGSIAGVSGNYLARYLHTPRIYNAQQIMQDYLDVLKVADLRKSNKLG